MPESPALQDRFEIDLPPSDVPIRQGEEGSLAMLNLEDKRRKDSEVQALRDALKRLEGTATGEAMKKFAGAKSAARRQRILRGKVEELKKGTFRREDRWEGPCAP